MTLYVFNPEHDLCLANGDRNFVPPQSSLDFAENGKVVMRMLYGDDAEVTTAAGFGQWLSTHGEPSRIVPWGWDMRLKQQLLKQAMPDSLMPDDSWIEEVRELQHRTTVLPLQPHALSASTLYEVRSLVAKQKSAVLKSPWSGAGRGVRWVDGTLSPNDEQWVQKTIVQQRCVIVEQRLKVSDDFALLMMVENRQARVTGLSLFATQSGVYRHNLLLADDEIRRRVGLTAEMESSLLGWVQMNVAPFFDGPLGVDLLRTADGEIFVSEMNLRHTMGMVAHSVLQRKPERAGSVFTVTP